MSTQKTFESTDHTRFEYWEDRAGLVKVMPIREREFHVPCAALEEFVEHVQAAVLTVGPMTGMTGKIGVLDDVLGDAPLLDTTHLDASTFKLDEALAAAPRLDKGPFEAQRYALDSEFCRCDEPDPKPIGMGDLEVTWEALCRTCGKKLETGPQELLRLSTDRTRGSLFLAVGVNAVMGLSEANDIERLGALADMIEAIGRQVGEGLAEAEPEKKDT